MTKNVRPKTFENGDIVYWCRSLGNGKYNVGWGMVYEHFSDAVVIDYLEPRERRIIVIGDKCIPIDEFQSETKYKKLPKGWSYDTRLFKIEYEPFCGEKMILIDIYDPSSVKSAYDKGYLVKSENIFHGNLESEITKDGYRIVKKYPMCAHHIDHVSINPWKVYFTYDEAKKEVDENIAEFTRQANLSDYDWSVEQIDKDLDRYKKITCDSDEHIGKIRDFLLGLDKVEDVETRISGGEIQWKYWKNKKWLNIEV